MRTLRTLFIEAVSPNGLGSIHEALSLLISIATVLARHLDLVLSEVNLLR